MFLRGDRKNNTVVEPMPSTCEGLGFIFSNVAMEAPQWERPAPIAVKSLLPHN